MLSIENEYKIGDETDSSRIIDASFSHKGLTNDEVRTILLMFCRVETLDLSYNSINALPRGIPRTLKALNLSNNSFGKLLGFSNVENLVELNLSQNHIER